MRIYTRINWGWKFFIYSIFVVIDQQNIFNGENFPICGNLIYSLALFSRVHWWHHPTTEYQTEDLWGPRAALHKASTESVEETRQHSFMMAAGGSPCADLLRVCYNSSDWNTPLWFKNLILIAIIWGWVLCNHVTCYQVLNVVAGSSCSTCTCISGPVCIEFVCWLAGEDVSWIGHGRVSLYLSLGSNCRTNSSVCVCVCDVCVHVCVTFVCDVCACEKMPKVCSGSFPYWRKNAPTFLPVVPHGYPKSTRHKQFWKHCQLHR